MKKCSTLTYFQKIDNLSKLVTYGVLISDNLWGRVFIKRKDSPPRPFNVNGNCQVFPAGQSVQIFKFHSPKG